MTSRRPRAPHPVPIRQGHRLTSFTANGIDCRYSNRRGNVKANHFRSQLFKQTGMLRGHDLLRWTRRGISLTEDLQHASRERFRHDVIRNLSSAMFPPESVARHRGRLTLRRGSLPSPATTMREERVRQGWKTVVISGGFAAILFALPTLAQCQSGLSDAPVSLIVPYAAGGVADVGMRILGDKLSGRLKQPFVIENRPVPAALRRRRPVRQRQPTAIRY